jgi:hypothetical protein
MVTVMATVMDILPTIIRGIDTTNGIRFGNGNKFILHFA